MEPKRLFGWADSRKQFANQLTKWRGRSAVWLALAAMPMVVGLGSGARATSLTWDSGGTHPLAPVDGSGNWDTATAWWSAGVAPDVDWDNVSTAIFGAANGAAGTVTIDTTTVDAGGLTFDGPGSGNYTIAAGSGDTLTLIGATPTIAVATGLTPTISAGVVSVNGLSFTGAGSGTLILSAANSIVGTTTINSGQLQITNAGGFGSSTVIVDSGGQANANNNGTVTNSFTIAGNGTSASQLGALVDQNHSETFGGTITLSGNARIGNGGFTSTFSNPIAGGSNSIEFFSSASGASTFRPASTASIWGAATVTAAGSGNSILFMTASSILPTAAPMTLNATSTGLAELDMEGRSETVAGLFSTGNVANDKVINNGTTGAGTLTISMSGNAVFGGVIIPGTSSGANAVTKAGTGMQILAGANTYAGTTTISGGTLAVTGSLLSTGAVTLNAATLAGTGSVGNVTTNNAAAIVNPGASGAGSIGTLAMSSLVVKGGSLQFDLSNSSVPGSNDSINVSGTTTFSSGTPTIAPTAGEAAGIYTVLTSTGGITYTVTPTLVTPTVTGRPQTFGLNTNANNIQVVVTGGAANIVWAGGVAGFTGNGADGSTWDNLHGTGAGLSNDQNWNNGGTQDYFFDGDSVSFNDVGSPNQNVNLATMVSPSAVSVNSGGSYTFSGSGSIGGVGNLTQGGAGTLTLLTSNTYSGGTTISNGALNANVASALGSGPIVLNSPGQMNINNAAFGSGTITINGGTIDNTSGTAIPVSTNNPQVWAGSFTFVGSSSLNLGSGAVTLMASPIVTVVNNTLSVGGSIGGNFGLTKAGGGTLVLSGSSTYSGATNITGGTIVVTGSGSLGSLSGSGVTIDGGTLDVGGDATANNVQFNVTNSMGLAFTIAGTGAGGIGAITNSNATVTQFNTFRGNNVTLSDDALISGNRIDIGRDGTVFSTLTLNNHTLTLNMSGSQPMFGIESHAIVTAGNIVVAAGTLDIEQNASVLDTAGTSTITFDSGTNAQFFQTTAGDTTRPMIFDGNNTIGSGSTTTAATVNSPMTLMGNVTLEAVTNGIPSLTSNSSLTMVGNISESGGSYSVSKAGVSTVTLAGVNTYSGNTNVSGGMLTLGGGGTIASANITVSSGAVLNNNGLFTASPTATVGGTLNYGANTGASILARNLTALNVSSGGLVTVADSTPRSVLSTGAVTFADTTGKIDLGSNDMIVHSGANGETVLPVIVSSVALGRAADGSWTGNGITSSAAASAPSTTALGVILNDTNASSFDPVARGTLSGTGIMSSFDGQAVADGDVLIKYTFVGDADLSGTITSADYAQIDNAFAYNSANPSTPMGGWYNGDFNYDGLINGDDYTLIDNAFNTQGATTFTAIPAEIVSSVVPEPTTLAVLVMGAGGLLVRRRRKME
jgi:autotransporter-associated beta strand protein